LKDENITPEQKKILQIFERTFKCYIIEDDKAKARGVFQSNLAFSSVKVPFKTSGLEGPTEPIGSSNGRSKKWNGAGIQ
jgi:hypothetical protein